MAWDILISLQLFNSNTTDSFWTAMYLRFLCSQLNVHVDSLRYHYVRVIVIFLLSIFICPVLSFASSFSYLIYFLSLLFPSYLPSCILLCHSLFSSLRRVPPFCFFFHSLLPTFPYLPICPVHFSLAHFCSIFPLLFLFDVLILFSLHMVFIRCFLSRRLPCGHPQHPTFACPHVTLLDRRSTLQSLSTCSSTTRCSCSGSTASSSSHTTESPCAASNTCSGTLILSSS